jgi:hypothetical protein
MFGRVLIAGVVLGAVLVTPRAVSAGEWPWPVEGRLGLAYAEPWTDGSGRRCSHGGLDVEAPAGARVSSCASGRVAFAGRIPAAGGGTALAVSVMNPDGLRVTYMPLASCSVAAGMEIVAGAPIGELAGSGDGSLAESHLHLSVRRGEAPIDPVTLLRPSAPPGVTAPVADVGPPAAVSVVHARGAQPGAASAGAPAPAPASVAQAPVPTRMPAERASAAGVPQLAPLWPPSRIETRIRPLPYAPTLDVRAALAQARGWAAAGRGMAIRVLLGLLAAVLFAPIVRVASRSTATISTLAPEPAHARRVRE